MEKIKLAVYGSLRLNQYNYKYFKNKYKDDFKYLYTTTIKGYKLFSLGSYPGIKECKNSELTVDILEVSPEAFMRINDMEIGAGYELKPIISHNEKLGIYLYRQYTNDNMVVPSGDWSQYLKQNKIII